MITGTTTKQVSERNKMGIDLYKMSMDKWVVDHHSDMPHLFENADKASDYLMVLGVQDEHIDYALVEMAVKGTTRANFGINGTFTFSDGATIKV